jgi:hypothetical protein
VNDDLLDPVLRVVRRREKRKKEKKKKKGADFVPSLAG